MRLIQFKILLKLHCTVLQVNVSDEGNPKEVREARGHLIQQVIGDLNKRTLRSQNKQD